MLWLGALILGLFLLTVLFGAPYVPTKSADIKSALELLDLKPNEVLIDLGAGDGRVMIAAARRGWQTVGYEINPILWLIAWWRLRPYGELTQIRLGSYKWRRWPERVDGIYIFGSYHEMNWLKTRLASQNGTVKLVSYGFALPDFKPKAAKGSFYLYRV